eukprot:612121-Rhodomonas_salina.2
MASWTSQHSNHAQLSSCTSSARTTSKSVPVHHPNIASCLTHPAKENPSPYCEQFKHSQSCVCFSYAKLSAKLCDMRCPPMNSLKTARQATPCHCVPITVVEKVHDSIRGTTNNSSTIK